MLGKFRFAAFAAALGIAAFAAGAANAQGRITLGTNPQGSIYYTVGGGIAAALQEALGRQVTVQPYTGSSVYLPLVASGELTLGINSSLDTGGVYRGDYGSKAEPKLRMLSRLWPLRIAFMVRANSDMKEVKDLKGKKVVTDFSALKAVGLANQAMIKAGGLKLDDVKGVTVAGLVQGIDGLTDGSLDATSIAVGIPLTQQAHASIPGGIRYLSITGPGATDENLDKLFAGTYLLPVKPSPRLPEVTEPVTVLGYDVFLTTSADLPDEEATKILEALYKSWPKIREDYPPVRSGIQKEMAKASNTAPYHPAAIAFFKKMGLWTEANDKKEATFSK
ncbi:MAG: TAXI family TRAP transporter solute-binding subunit [Salaquimonas sp.]|nr:TAXI family TRAP transporter solute-binding subunit [Salaquimonas sp.]